MTAVAATELPLPRIAPRKGARRLRRRRRAPAARGDRSRERVRRRHARADPAQGRGAHAAHARGGFGQLGRARHASHAQRRRRTRSSTRFPRSTRHRRELAGRAMLCRRADGLSDRVRDSRLHHGLGVEGVRGATARSPASRCRADCARATGSNRRSSARRRRRRPGTTRTSRVSRMAEIVGDDAARELERLTRARLRARARDRRAARDHHRRHEVRVRQHAVGRDPARSMKC